MNTRQRKGEGINNTCGIRGFLSRGPLITREKKRKIEKKIPSGHIDATERTTESKINKDEKESREMQL